VQQELFLCDEVLHMNVDNLVESSGSAGVNSAQFNTMIRIAQLWCNIEKLKCADGKLSEQSDEGHGVVDRKTQLFRAEESSKRKTSAIERAKR
jgi:hypothetical protein